VDISERRRAEEALREKRETLQFLREISEEINRSLDLDEVLNHAIDKVLEKMGADIAAITVLDEKKKVLSFLVSRGFELDSGQTNPIIRIGEGATGRVALTGEPLILSDYLAFPHAFRDILHFEKIRSTAVFPLKIREKIIGTLNIAYAKPREFSPEDISFLESVSPIIATALNNAHIYQQTLSLNAALEELSRKDGLTGVFNRRYLEEHLAEEINRCERHGGDLGMLMIDLDEFKGINDTYGHETGDEALKMVAEAVRESCRSIDVVGRYGGDEFLVLLFQTSYEEAQRIADRIRNRVKEMRIPGVPLEIGLSIGVASENRDYRSILRLADDRMYEEKKRHKPSP
jgi:diguanylate cyclase (GGDEF)-like protein